MRLNVQHERNVHTTKPGVCFFFSVFFWWKGIMIIVLDCIIVPYTSPLPVSTPFAVPFPGPSEVWFVQATCFGWRYVSGHDIRRDFKRTCSKGLAFQHFCHHFEKSLLQMAAGLAGLRRAGSRVGRPSIQLGVKPHWAQSRPANPSHPQTRQLEKLITIACHRDSVVVCYVNNLLVQ